MNSFVVILKIISDLHCHVTKMYIMYIEILTMVYFSYVV